MSNLSAQCLPETPSTTIHQFHVTRCSTNHGRSCYERAQGHKACCVFFNDSLVAARGKTSAEHDVLRTFAGRVNDISAIHCVLQEYLAHTSLAGRLAESCRVDAALECLNNNCYLSSVIVTSSYV